MAPRFSMAIGRFGATVVVTLRGTVDAAASMSLARVLHDLIDGQGNLALVIDLRDLDEIDSSGVEVLASAAAAERGRGGVLRLSGPSEVVLDSLVGVGLPMTRGTPSDFACLGAVRVRGKTWREGGSGWRP